MSKRNKTLWILAAVGWLSSLIGATVLGNAVDKANQSGLVYPVWTVLFWVLVATTLTLTVSASLISLLEKSYRLGVTRGQVVNQSAETPTVLKVLWAVALTVLVVAVATYVVLLSRTAPPGLDYYPTDYALLFLLVSAAFAAVVFVFSLRTRWLRKGTATPIGD